MNRVLAQPVLQALRCLGLQKMVPNGAQRLNSIPLNELFDELERWNKLLEAEDIDWEVLEP